MAFKKDDFFAALSMAQNKPVPVNVKGFGTLFVKSMTLADQEAWEETLSDEKGNKIHGRIMASFIAQVCVDEQGNKVFDESDIPKLNELKSGPLKSLFAEAQKHNEFSSGDIEELEKN
ncbi:hypothetical protein [Pseudoalteromonas peptidolytica]|uniref:Uncharacterized protein n=1 Tax=Pseudoalteromonas peptidolytica F12-50-A1 TaxID=1315280 RepID=A0A8I0T5B2_9GAMM|nr:hypothetical protein [Pseudoalteromonas peptidolytica]MBE0348286.1 hypothetical protein [Pseudoalteromonas peptidolytica F12-50-A1]NLR16571.1 hypothetical protein [Pseudoalteromonas peptidolytica]GEK08941.1 hypothetical protein PPE03_11900 [Pseudoalteromonas peptidolytica]